MSTLINKSNYVFEMYYPKKKKKMHLTPKSGFKLYIIIIIRSVVLINCGFHIRDIFLFVLFSRSTD